MLDVEPGFKGLLEMFANTWRGKVVGRERSGRALLVDPRWREEEHGC